jgi:hypothetical protein
MYGSKVGWPIQIADDDIHVEMPSTVPGGIHDEQFSDTQFLVASIHLARITGQVIEKVYSRKKQPDSFLQREQKLLISLKQWAQALPPHVRLNRDGAGPKNVVSLHLQFNQVSGQKSGRCFFLDFNLLDQCIILATRPILLYTLIQSRDADHADQHTTQTHVQTLKTLSDACIHAARHNHSLIVAEWTNGSLPIMGYFYAHYLFSAALIMVLSSQIQSDNHSDYALFETAFEILRAMRDHGNLAATEFYDNLECVQQCLDKTQPSHVNPSAKRGSTAHNSLTGQSSRIPDQHPTDALPVLPDQAAQRASEVGLSGGSALPDTNGNGGALGSTFGNEMVFLDESMEQFLAQPDVDFGPLDPSGVPISVADAVYSWPNFSLWTA